MIVRDLNLHSTLVCPVKAHAPLVVDADTVLPRAPASQRFETMRGRDTQVGQSSCRNDPLQPHPRPSLNIRRQVAYMLSIEHSLGTLVSEPCHSNIVSRDDNSVKELSVTCRLTLTAPNLSQGMKVKVA